ncbi:MAG: diphosphomevalonate decarboxylase [Candidatus Altiarchaeales archaeon HGW-Altiarchaeales-1]|nr:MAG: diphosphomevalonate decarboxylase [Candidatus Altiarchaeales archaeon HGW-Altiarchaeales-1]
MKFKATAIAHPNIAFVKYWGKKDEDLRIPLNNSISMNLGNLWTKTTVEFNDFDDDIVIINKEVAEGTAKERVVKHLDKFRNLASNVLKAKVVSENNFPMSSGIASSASGFAALTMASASALNLNLSEKELSILARLGSGSACRSIPDGFTEWLMGTSNDDSYAVSLAPAEHFEIYDLVVIIRNERKEISSTKGMQKFNPYFYARLAEVSENLNFVRKGIIEKNLKMLGTYAEKDCISMHTVMMNSGLFYWEPETLKIIKEVWNLRKNGTECYLTIDAGPNVHVLCLPENKEKIKGKFSELNFEILESKPGGKARVIGESLF